MNSLRPRRQAIAARGALNADVRRQMIARQLVVVALALTLLGCDVVTNRYATLQDARADSLFQRGWLPDILPPSSHDIRTSNDLDLNFSSGEFYFSPKEFPDFTAVLHAYTGRESPLEYLDRDISLLTHRGFKPYEYVTADTVWVFLCNAERGVCEYRMWTQPTSERSGR